MKGNQLEEKLIDTVESLRDEIIELTLALVAEPSTLGQETGAVAVLAERLDLLGFEVQRVPMDSETLRSHPGYAPTPWPPGGRENLVGTLPAAAGGGRSALFNGHLDVVGVADTREWSSDPFTPMVRDGWIHGRGAGDMKSGVAAMTYAAAAVGRAGFGLRAPVSVEAVLEEECSGNGALACLAAGHQAEAVLIPEPFGPAILTDQLGVLWFKVSLRGRPTHVLEAPSGVNAIEKCYPLFKALRYLEERLNRGGVPEAYARIQHPINLNIGVIEGGDWPSTVPSEACFHARLSYFPGIGFQQISTRIKEVLAQAAETDPWLHANPPEVEFYGFRSDGHSLSRDLPALTTLAGCHQSLTGELPASYVSTCTTDLRAFTWFSSAQATCYGPVAENIHGIDERVELESVIAVAKTYALFLARWCGLCD